ncbi:hypothetical protein NQ314_008572 [Rhamnusium bicolor]|uniref:Aminotransferase class I/classII large domain-containing protein n=1 Tax=Rhamnusium bicolor TaxID=1586634 RepID=A0AAV8Y7X4_9CUCU|nr:hypothetical protein NQ314_008572 [Rhamnusium bicolor]
MPNEVTFPFEQINVVLKDGSQFTLQGSELHSALQYIPTQGYPPLIKSLKEFTFKIHQPPNWQNREVLVTNGSQDGISKSLEMIVEEGDDVLVQNPLYTGTEIILKPFRPNLLGVEQDDFGIIPKKLIDVLETCKAKYTEEGGGRRKMPKVIYINPTGSNPTGTTMSLERRKEIYQICCKYNILILEDDAYCFLHFLDKQPVSFLSLDTEGRVIRFDSMSKVLSSGLRLGWFYWKIYFRNGVSRACYLTLHLLVHTTGLGATSHLPQWKDILRDYVTGMYPPVACSYGSNKTPLKQIDKAMNVLAELIREEQLLLRRKLDSLENNIIR